MGVSFELVINISSINKLCRITFRLYKVVFVLFYPVFEVGAKSTACKVRNKMRKNSYLCPRYGGNFSSHFNVRYSELLPLVPVLVNRFNSFSNLLPCYYVHMHYLTFVRIKKHLPPTLRLTTSYSFYVCICFYFRVPVDPPRVDLSDIRPKRSRSAPGAQGQHYRPYKWPL